MVAALPADVPHDLAGELAVQLDEERRGREEERRGREEAERRVAELEAELSRLRTVRE